MFTDPMLTSTTGRMRLLLRCKKLRFGVCVWVCVYMSVRACMLMCVLTVLCLDTSELCVFFPSPHAVPDRLRLRVNRISLQEYDRLQYDKERLRDICKNRVCVLKHSRAICVITIIMSILASFSSLFWFFPAHNVSVLGHSGRI